MEKAVCCQKLAHFCLNSVSNPEILRVFRCQVNVRACGVCPSRVLDCVLMACLFLLAQGTFKVYPLPGDPNAPMPLRALSNLPPSAPEDCVVRVYIVRAMDLQPNDPSGLVSSPSATGLCKRVG